jgi:hypothetical protein
VFYLHLTCKQDISLNNNTLIAMLAEINCCLHILIYFFLQNPYCFLYPQSDTGACGGAVVEALRYRQEGHVLAGSKFWVNWSTHNLQPANS